jgi:hypothetical protein
VPLQLVAEAFDESQVSPHPLQLDVDISDDSHPFKSGAVVMQST